MEGGLGAVGGGFAVWQLKSFPNGHKGRQYFTCYYLNIKTMLNYFWKQFQDRVIMFKDRKYLSIVTNVAVLASAASFASITSVIIFKYCK